MMPNPSIVACAYAAISPHVVRTPLLQASTLNKLISERLSTPNLSVYVKAESLQHTGAFKFRGAYNRLLHLTPKERAFGVVAFSSGNFSQALALASSKLNIECTIVAPHDAPALKLSRTAAYGAKVLLSTPPAGVNREVAAGGMAKKFSIETGATLLHPFDDYEVMAGQGTLAMEVYEQVGDGVDVASLVVPTGGGGMLAGCSLASQLKSPKTDIYAVEPAGYDDHCQSFASKGKARIPLTGDIETTICDALQASAPGELTWQVNRKYVSGTSYVSDEGAVEAMKVAFTELKLVLEPSGALGLASLLAGNIPVKGDDVIVVVACGGNISLEEYTRLLS